MQIHVARDTQKFGPYSPDEVRARLAAGELRETDLAWHDGLAAWQPLSSLAAAGGTGAPPLPIAQMPMPPRPAETCPLAVASLVCGIASFTAVPVLAALPAVVCGHISLSRMRASANALGGRGLAVAGLVMGYLNFALLALVGILFFSVVAAIVGTVRQNMLTGQALVQEVPKTAKDTLAIGNAKQLWLACKLYAQDHSSSFPANLQMLVPDYISDAKVLTCPYSADSEPVGYDYFTGRETDPDHQVLIVSKGATAEGKRVVIRVDGSGGLEDYVAAPR